MLIKILFVVTFGLLAFDFRSEVQGGDVFQYSLVGTASFLFALLVLGNLNRWWQITGLQRRFIYAIAALVMFAVVIMWKNHISSHYFVRVMAPLMFGLSAFISMSLYIKDMKDIKFLVRCILFSAITSMTWKAFYAFFLLGITTDTLRFQLLSQGTGVIFAVAVFKLLLTGRSMLAWFTGLVTSAMEMILSLTRTHLLSATIVILMSIGWLYFLKGALPANRYRRAGFVLGAALAICVFVVTPLTVYFRPDVYDNWRVRLFETQSAGQSMDPTTAMRLAQIRGQLFDLAKNPADILFGRGFGNACDVDVNFYMEKSGTSMLQESEKQVLLTSSWQNPDSMYVPALYSGGLYFLGLLLMLMLNAVSGVRKLKMMVRHTDLFEAYGVCFFAFIYMITVGLFGNFLLDRYGSPLFFSLVAVMIAISQFRLPPLHNKNGQNLRKP